MSHPTSPPPPCLPSTCLPVLTLTLTQEVSMRCAAAAMEPTHTWRPPPHGAVAHIISAGHALHHHRHTTASVIREEHDLLADQIRQFPHSIRIVMEDCNLGTIAMEAQQQRDHHQSPPGADDPISAVQVLTCLTFLEHKIGHLRGVISSAPRPPRQMVSAELSCIALQLVSISNSLAGAADQDDATASRSPFPAPTPDEGDSDSSDHDDLPPAGSYEVIELGKDEILAPHVHSCKVCGKGFKRDANLRMHMRGHGEEYKTAAALAKPPAGAGAAPPPSSARCFYSCPFVGCKRNRGHRSFQPLKTAVCVKNHYRRSHCDKSFTCRRCNVKRFSVLADLRTHEKHCGRDRWVCSCGTSFSRKDKLFTHVAAFDGHAPALPAEDHAAAAATMDFSSNSSMLDGLSCSDIKGFAIAPMDGQCLDDGRGSISPTAMGIEFCDFDGFDLFGAQTIDF